MSALSSFVPDWLAKRAILSPSATALIDVETQKALTYCEWNQQVNQTAAFMQYQGVMRGDCVAVLASNCVEYLDVFFACNKLGSVLQALNWRLTAHELIGILKFTPPKILIYSNSFAETVKSLKNALSHFSIRWICLEKTSEQTDVTLQERAHFSATPLPPPSLQMQDAWAICYTGGTTGLPKGAMLTYRSVQANAINTIVSWGLTANDVAILNAPLFHTGGLNVFTTPLVFIGGCSLVCKGFNPNQTFDLIKNKGVTLFFGVPTMFVMLQQHEAWATADFSRLKMVISGGAACPLPIFEKFWAKGVAFKTGYGLTEAGPNTFYLPPEDVQRKPNSVGFPLFNIDVKVVHPDGSVCEANEVGELLIRGQHVFGGYWNQADATANTVIDGWLHTGDLAYHDAEGYYYIAGRSKDMIISGGENIYPSEIESVLFGHPQVIEAAVVGLPDEKWGEIGCAFIVANSKDLTIEQLQSYCRERLANYKIPKSFIFVETLPKTGAGKLDKMSLKKRSFEP